MYDSGCVNLDHCIAPSGNITITGVIGPLKYQHHNTPLQVASYDELLTIKFRYNEPAKAVN